MASSDSPPKEDRASMYQLEDDDNSNSEETSTSRTTEDNEDEETVKTATAASTGKFKILKLYSRVQKLP